MKPTMSDNHRRFPSSLYYNDSKFLGFHLVHPAAQILLGSGSVVSASSFSPAAVHSALGFYSRPNQILSHPEAQMTLGFLETWASLSYPTAQIALGFYCSSLTSRAFSRPTARTATRVYCVVSAA